MVTAQHREMLDQTLAVFDVKPGYDMSRLNSGRRLVLITGHRREKLGEGFINICTAIKYLCEMFTDVDFVYPMHLNPNVRRPIREVFGENLHAYDNMFFIEPLQYLEFVYLMSHAHIALTDSGGIQEPEALSSGTVHPVGTRYDKIVSEVSELPDSSDAYAKMSQAGNLYGNGRASERIITILRED